MLQTLSFSDNFFIITRPKKDFSCFHFIKSPVNFVHTIKEDPMEKRNQRIDQNDIFRLFANRNNIGHIQPFLGKVRCKARRVLRYQRDRQTVFGIQIRL